MSDDNAPRCHLCGNRHYGTDCGVLVRKDEAMVDANEKTLVDYRDCLELANDLSEAIQKADGSWCYEGDDLPAQFIPVLKPVIKELLDGRQRIAELESKNALLRAMQESSDGIRSDLFDRGEELEKMIVQYERANRILELKNSTSLANNLCPDHRDKQSGKPCLACRIEELEAELNKFQQRLLQRQRYDSFE